MQLLCIRLLDIPRCHWSGGFRIEGVSSFHLCVRDADGRGTFLRIEISTLMGAGATFSIVISDAGNFPPPFRVDNFSEVNHDLVLLVRARVKFYFALLKPLAPWRLLGLTDRKGYPQKPADIGCRGGLINYFLL